MSPTVLVTAPGLASPAQEALEQAGCRLIEVPDGGGVAELRRMLSSEPVAGLIAWKLPVDAETIAAAGPSLRVISRHGAGVDNVDVAAATERGIIVTRAPGANAQAVAELAIGLMIAVARSIPANDAGMRAGGWPSQGMGRELAELRLGLVGFGDIARRVSRIASAIGMTTRFYDPAVTGPQDEANPAPSLKALLESSDVLSLHCPLTPDTRGLIDAAALASLPPGAMVINTARGPLIDEAALVAALETGRVARAGLDVFETEPLSTSHRLREMPQVVLSPHVGGSTGAARNESARQAAESVIAVLDGRHPRPGACVNPEALSGKPST
jgi:D-3-phosphoglycerate dehydrogenase / 2-oxoglutarate reductase